MHSNTSECENTIFTSLEAPPVRLTCLSHLRPRSKKGSDEITEAGVGERAPVQVRAVLLRSADRDWGNRSVRR